MNKYLIFSFFVYSSVVFIIYNVVIAINILIKYIIINKQNIRDDIIYKR